MSHWRSLRLEHLEDRHLLSLSPLDIEFSVGSTLDGIQNLSEPSRAPAMAADAAGNYVLVWSVDQDDGNGYDVYAQRFNSAGSQLSNAFQVNTTEAGDQKFGSVACDDAGNFVITWSSAKQDHDGYGVYARRYDSSGKALDDEFRVNTTIENNQDFSAVAVAADGHFVITWTSQDQDGNGTGIYGQLYAFDGTATGEEFQVNSYTLSNQRYSNVAFDEQGNFIVTWSSYLQDDSSNAVIARRFNDQGEAQTDDFIVNTTTLGNQQFSSVVVDATGNFIVAWQGYDLTTGMWNVYLQRFDPLANPLGEEQVLGQGRFPTVTWGPNGDFIAAWETYDRLVSVPTDLVIQHFDQVGNLAGDPVVLSNYYGYDQEAPALAVADDRLLIFWASQVPEGAEVLALMATVSEVSQSNRAPVLTAVPSQRVVEGETLSLQLEAVDTDDPSDQLFFSLGSGAPEGLTIDSYTGLITWTPTEEQGPGVYSFEVLVMDDGTPPLGDATVVSISVEEGNQAPVLPTIIDYSIGEGDTVSFSAEATDADQPENTLVYTLKGNVPSGASIDPSTGEFNFTATENHGGQSYTITIQATDNGSPALSDTAEFTITVADTNTPPVLAAIDDQTIGEGNELSLLVTATDADDPPNTLTFLLDSGAPAGAAIDPESGLFTWTPSESQGPGTYEITVRVIDNGSPPLSDTATFQVTVTDVNSAPVFEPVDDQTIGEGESLWMTLKATDADVPANVLTFALDVSSPTGVTLDPQSGILVWTPTEEQGPGVYTITAYVYDDASPTAVDSISFDVTVEEVNQAPVFDAIEDQIIGEQQTLAFTITATDADSPANTLTYSLAPGAPTGTAIDSTTGEFTWTPSATTSLGTYDITVIVTDDGSPVLSDTATFQVSVVDANYPPQLSDISDQTAAEGELFTLTAVATDPDARGDTLTFSLDAGAPTGAAIDPTTGVFTWTPTEVQGGFTYEVTIRVTDDGLPNLSDAVTFSITVEETNQAPIIQAIGDQTITEGSLLALTVRASDPDDPANSFTYSLGAGAPAGAAINASSGLFTFTPTENQGPGTYSVTVRVTDDGSPAQTAVATFSIEVTEGNGAPSLEDIDNQYVLEGQTLSFSATASDPDTPANVLTFSLDAGAPAGATINPNTGLFSWTPTEAQGPGSYSITVRVTDDGDPALSDTTTFSIEVGEQNQPPVFEAVDDQTVGEGQTLSLTLRATDPDLPAATLTYSFLAAAPTGATLNSSTGVFRWTPAEGQVGTYTITVQVADDGNPALTDSMSFTVTVTETNSPPQLTPIEDQTVRQGETLSFLVEATDPDIPADQLTFSLDEAPQGATIDPVTGQFRWALGTNQPTGSYPVTIRVTDDGDPALSSTTSFTIVVNDVNYAPELVAIADKTVAEGSTLSFAVEASDPDTPPDLLSYRLLEGAPAGAAINPTTGVFTFTPTEAQGPGIYEVTVEVSDNVEPTAAVDTATFRIQVTEVNSAPVLAAIDDVEVQEGETLSLTASATDSDQPANTLSYSLASDAPDGMTIDSQTGQITWTPQEGQGPARYDITVRVSDNGSPQLTDETTFTVRVGEQNTPPVVESIADYVINEGETLGLTAVATDSDNPANQITFSLDAGAPAGAVINPQTGQFTWTPTEAQGPCTYEITVRATDDGFPAESGTATFTVTVIEVNTAPQLAAIGNQVVAEGKTLELTATVVDADLPAQQLTFSLESGAPEGATIDPTTGVLQFTPNEDQGGTNYEVTIRVDDDGSPALFDTVTFTISVGEINHPPEMPQVGDQTISEGQTLSLSFAASDPDGSSDAIVYSLAAGAPAGAVLDSSTGAFSWTPTEADGPGTYEITVRAADGGTPIAKSEQTITITVEEVNQAPVLAPIEDYSVVIGRTLTIATSAADGDQPANNLRYSLGSDAPEGATIDPITGVFSWTPPVTATSGNYEITVQVTDNGSPALTATQSFNVQLFGLTALGNVDWGRVDYLRFYNHDVLDGDRNTLQPAYDGRLTIEAFFDPSQGDVSFVLVDPEGNTVGTSSTSDGYVRLDAVVEAGDMYEVLAVGANSSVDFRVTNLLSESGDQAILHGSSGNDSFFLNLASTYYVKINGVNYEMAAWQINDIRIEGNGGNDTAEVVGSKYNDTATFWPTSAELVGEGHHVQVVDVAQIALRGGGGIDTAYFYDSAGDDEFVATSAYGSLSGDGYYNQARWFNYLYAYASEGVDGAKLYDSSGDDVFVATPEYGGLSGEGFNNRVEGFDGVYAYSTLGGEDVARFYDSAGDDIFYIDPIQAAMYADTYYNRAKFFSSVYGYATEGGADRAELFDSAGDDHLTASPGDVILSGDGYTSQAKHFEVTIARSNSGGNDTAELYDTEGDDSLVTTSYSAWISGEGYSNDARGFDTTYVYATEGNDTATFYDSAGNDVFVATPQTASMQGSSFLNWASNFDAVLAYATAGGVDAAKLYDSAGDDIFIGTDTYGTLYGEGYYNRAKNFDAVYAFATAGGNDTAELYDSVGNDTFYTDANQAALYGDGFYNRAKFFDAVHAYAESGGHDIIEFNGSTGDDDLYATPTYARFSGSSFYYEADQFEEMQATGGGGNDRAVLIDSELIDYLEAESNWARLTNSDLGFLLSVTDFAEVTVRSNHGPDLKSIAAAVDFLLLEGTWKSP